MNNSAKAWQEVLEEFDSETAFWAQFRLPSVKQAMHFAPWEGEKADTKLIASGALINAKKYYPYVEGLEDSINEALRWMKRPSSRLREGLVRLSEGEQPEDLFAFFKFYGDFREHLAVLYARNPDHAGFANQRKGTQAPQKKKAQTNKKNIGQKISYKLKRFAASYMMATIKARGCSVEVGIKKARQDLEEFAARIVIKEKKAPEEFADYNYEELLQRVLARRGFSERRCYELNEKFRKELTPAHLHEWIDEILVLKIQRTILSDPRSAPKT